MSTSYTDVFTGKNITPAFPQYSAIALTANIELSWPAQFQNTNKVVSVVMDITPDAGGRTVKMPDAREGSVGFEFTINNPGGFNFDLINHHGDLILTVDTLKANLIWLIDNSDVNGAGTWRNIPAFGGAGAVSSINETSDNNNIVIGGVPITTAGTITLSLQRDLLALTGLAASVGYAVRTAANTWVTRSILGTAGQIVVTNQTAVPGNTSFALDPNLTGLASLTLTALTFGVATASTIAGTAANVDLTLTANGTGSIALSKDMKLAASKKIKFIGDNATNYVTIRAGNTGANQDLIWPISAGGVDQVIKTDGSGQLAWGTVPTFPGVTTINAVARYSNITGTLKDSINFIVTDAGEVSGLLSAEIGALRIATDGTRQTIATTGGDDLIIAPTGLGVLDVRGDIYVRNSNATQRQIRLYNFGDGAFAGLRATPGMPVDVTWNLPIADSVGMFVSDGLGQMTIIPYSAEFPITSTINAVPRFSTITGRPLKDSLFLISDAGAGTGLISCTIGNINVSLVGNTIASSNANGNINLVPNGIGFVNLSNATASTSTGSGAFVCAGGIGVTLKAFIGGALNVTDSTASTTTATGSGIFSGGVGIAGKAFIGGALNVTDATASTSTATGSGIFSGGLGVAGKAFVGGALNVTDATASTTTATGSGIFSGGLGVAGAAFIGGALNITDTTASTTTATGSGIFGGGVGIAGKAFIGGALNVTDTTDSTTVSTGSGIFSGGIGLAKAITAGGAIKTTATTASTSTTTGALIVGSGGSGGLGVAGKAFIGGALNVTDTTASTTTATGSGIFSGGVGIAGKAFIGGALNVTDTTDSTTVLTGSGIFSGGLGITKSVTIGTTLRLSNGAATFYTGFQAGAAAASTTYTLPLAFPATLGIVKSSSTGVMTIDALGAVAGPLMSDSAGVITVNNITTAANQVSKYSNTTGLAAASGSYLDSNNNLSLGTTAVGANAVNSLTMLSASFTSGAASGNTLILHARLGTGSDVIPGWYGAGNAGVTASVSAVVTTKISIWVNGTRYYLLASTSAT